MSGHRLFTPDRFALAAQVDQYELDPEVASTITETLYSRDRKLELGNNYVDPGVIVDPSGETATNVTLYKNEVPQDDWAYNVGFNAKESPDVNTAFATQMQTALFEVERQLRLGIKGSLALTAGLGAVPTGLVVAGFEVNPAHGAGILEVELIGSGLFLGYGLLKQMPDQFYRIAVTRPVSRLNRRYMDAAAETIKAMKLPPVVTPETASAS
ncbi:MAG TPA: hypothetical protein VHA05_01545 [Candidatus Saccharimonadales bacterium]|nr:hypothetical protein [Candidatus Saccharimonadales bacterium]